MLGTKLRPSEEQWELLAAELSVQPGITFYRLHRLSVVFHWGQGKLAQNVSYVGEGMLTIQAIVRGDLYQTSAAKEVCIQQGCRTAPLQSSFSSY